jgi:hypothetical protein
MSVYAVTYDLKAILHNYSGLYDELKKSPSWCYYIKDTFLIKTDETVEQIWARVQPHLEKDDFLLIIEVRRNYQGWLPKEAWDWLNTNLLF